ncbi:MAG: mechanosensitive ion channel family protein [Rhodospirillales bacterium]|nr:mechanosensitive ion channel family protein [Rhodospirillales bacterium]
MEKNIQTISTLIDKVIEFAVTYGFQILGALVFLVIGLKAASWAGRKISQLTESRNVDSTLARFIGNVTKLIVVVLIVIITLGNFGISTAPLIALAGAGAFGATMAIQGPLSNYGAGLSIILTRPFVVGNTITIGKVSGVVEDITLAATVLIGEDGERITVPNKEIVGQVIVNSQAVRVVETKIPISGAEGADRAIEALSVALAEVEGVADDPAPQVGLHDFTYGGVVVGLRYWAPSSTYFQTRYAVNQAALKALNGAGVALLPAMGASLAAPSLSSEA